MGDKKKSYLKNIDQYLSSYTLVPSEIKAM